MIDRERKVVSLEDVIYGHASQTTCPACKRERAYYATNTYYTSKGKQQLRQCRFCDFVRTETVLGNTPSK